MSMGIPSPGSLEWVPGDGTTELEWDCECDAEEWGCGWKGTITAYLTDELVEWECPKCDRSHEVSL